MRSFHEFVQEKGYHDIKLMVMDALDPDHSLDHDNPDILNQQLSDFTHDLLKSPGIVDIINRRPNRGAVLAALKNDTTTVGNLISMLAEET